MKLGGDYKLTEFHAGRISCPLRWETLQVIYDKLVAEKGLGTDTLAYDDDLAKQIRREFSKQAGRVVHAPLIVAAIIAKRKRGEWVKLGPDAGKNGRTGF